MRLKEFEIFEAATAGATTSGNIATVANPHVAHSKQKPKKVKPTDNALDMDVPLLSSKTPATIRRQIQEGSLYKNEELVEFKSRNWNSNNTIEKVFPGFGKNKKKTTPSFDDIMKRANSFDDLMKQRSKDSAIVNTEKSKRQTAKAAGYDAIMKGKDLTEYGDKDADITASGVLTTHLINKGSKSERKQPGIETDAGEVILLHVDGENAFEQPTLRKLMGKRIEVEGRMDRGALRISPFAITVTEEVKKKTIADPEPESDDFDYTPDWKADVGNFDASYYDSPEWKEEREALKKVNKSYLGALGTVGNVNKILAAVEDLDDKWYEELKDWIVQTASQRAALVARMGASAGKPFDWNKESNSRSGRYSQHFPIFPDQQRDWKKVQQDVFNGIEQNSIDGFLLANLGEIIIDNRMADSGHGGPLMVKHPVLKKLFK